MKYPLNYHQVKLFQEKLDLMLKKIFRKK